MNHENTINTIVYLANRLAQVERELEVQIGAKDYWYKAWKDASDRCADLQLIIDNSTPAKEAE